MVDTDGRGDFGGRRRLLQMQMLYEVGLAINESLDPAQVSAEILQRALTMVDARAGALLVQNDGGRLEVAGAVGFEPHAGELVGLAAANEAWDRRQLVETTNAGPGWQHLCVVPLESGQQVTGLLLVADHEQRNGAVGPFDGGDQALLRAFALQAGTALNNARLYRSLEQAYAELQAAQAKLAQLEQLRALGDVSAEVAHAMRHILGIIVGRADLCLTRRGDPEATLRAILDAAESGDGVLDRLQRCTRLGVGRAREGVDLGATVRQAVADIEALWADRAGPGAAGIEWRVELQSMPPTWANGADLQELVRNLLLNALEAMPEGGRLAVRSRLSAGSLVVEVEDTGEGMPADVCERVFEPFFTTKDRAGSGLGLSISYRIAADHGGELTVQSTPGVGSCFTVRLPVTAPPPRGEAEDAETDPDR